MTIFAPIGSKNESSLTQKWPDLGNPQEIADIMKGEWSSVPNAPVRAIMARINTIEDGLRDFLFIPQLFTKSNGTKARTALLASAEAIEMGATGIIAAKRPRNLDPAVPCLLVKDASDAIRRLGEYRRQQSRAKFIAVTGSVGKSTTKNMIHLLASSAGPSLRSLANYNNGMTRLHFGLSNLSSGHHYCVLEFSEDVSLDERMRLYRPHVAVVTNILWDHIDRMERQGYRGEQAIRRLAQLAAGVARHMEPGGICILNADEPNFEILAEEVLRSPNVRILTFGRGTSNQIRVVEMTTDAKGSSITIRIDGQDHSYQLGLPGAHMAANSVAAAAAAYCAGIPLEPALKSLATFEPDSHRGVRRQISWLDGSITIRDETISSSVPSLRSTFSQLEREQPAEGGRRVVVLGQINALGHTMPAVMKSLAHEADESSIDRFYTIGSDIRIFNEEIADRHRVAPHFQTLGQLEAALRKDLRAGDFVVLKGTRTPDNISLRRLVDRLTQNNHASVNPDPYLHDKVAKRIIICGDTYFGEYYQEKRQELADINYLETFGYDYSGRKLTALLRRSDFAIVNLECALTEVPTSELESSKASVLRGNPDETINALKNLNVNGVLLGNNHAMDYQSAGLVDTLHHLNRAGMVFSGAGKNRMEAQKPILKQFDIEGIPFKLAILSGYEYNTSHDKWGFFAGVTKPGVNNININRLKQQILGLKSEGYFIVLSPHWGQNYSFRTQDQLRMAHRFLNLGADLILGHGPHLMNELAQIDGVWIVYSLGNFIFNSEGEYETQAVQPFSLVAEIELRREGSAVKGLLNLYPIVSCNQLTQFQPTFVDDDQFAQVVDMLKAMQYDGGSFNPDIRLRQVDGRHCLTVKIF